MVKIKQKWGFTFLFLLSLIYVVINLYDTTSTDNKVTEIYFADRITAAHKILIDRYNKMNEGKVKVIPIDFPNYDFNSNERKELLARSLRGRGDGIDIFAVDIIWTQRFAKWSEPLGKYFSAEERANMLDYALESCYYNGELVAVPLNMAQGVMYYREDLLRELPNSNEIIRKVNKGITWNDFIAIKNSINSDNPFYIFPAADYEGLICSFMELLLSLDSKYFERYGFDFNTPAAQKSLQLLVDLVNNYKVTPKVVTEFTEIPSYEYFIKNNGFFIRGWQTYDKDFREAPFDAESESELVKAPLPYFSKGKPASIFGGWNIMISKFSDKKEESVKFIKFLLSESSQELFYSESGYHPIIKSFYEKEKYLKQYPEIPKLIEMHKLGVHRPPNVEYTRYSEVMSHYFELAIKNELDVKTALIETTNNIKKDRVFIQEF